MGHTLTETHSRQSVHPVAHIKGHTYQVSNRQRDTNAERMYTGRDVHIEGHTHGGTYLHMERDIHIKGNSHGGDIHTEGYTHGGDMYIKGHTHGGEMHMKGDAHGGDICLST